MDLSEKDLALLRRLRDFRENAPTVRTYLRPAWRGHAGLVALCAAGAGLFLGGGWVLMAGVLIGAGLASIARDVAWIRAIVRSWPLNREVLDWGRVDALLAERHEI